MSVPALLSIRIHVFHTLSYGEEFFESSVNNENRFLELITKLWWESNQLVDRLPFVAMRAFRTFHSGLACTLRQTEEPTIYDTDSKSERSVDIHATVTWAVSSDVDGLAKRVLEYLAPPLRSPHEKYRTALAALSVIKILATNFMGSKQPSDQTTKFTHYCTNSNNSACLVMRDTFGGFGTSAACPNGRDIWHISAPRSSVGRKWVPSGPVTQNLCSAEQFVTVTNMLLPFRPRPAVTVTAE